MKFINNLQMYKSFFQQCSMDVIMIINMDT